MSNVQISQELFGLLCHYHLLGTQTGEKRIKELLSDKLDACVKRELYSLYKTAESPEEREQARLQYLDKIGMHDSFRY